MPSPIIQVRTLGTAEIDVGAVQIRPNAPRRFAALLYLSAEAGRRVPRRVLIDLMFPGKSERNGLHSLRELVYQLRSAGVPLESDQDGVELPCPVVQCDYRTVLHSKRVTLEQIRAVQGGFLPGYAPDHSEAYVEWFDGFQAKTSFALSQVLLRDQARAADVANLEFSEAAARACLAISPLNEKAVNALAETIALGGAKADAERLLDEYAMEVGIRSPELKISAQALKRRIGERFPEGYRPAGELPFGGRDSEMVELRQHLVRSQAGLSKAVLVVGDPGIGKTRLVNEFAAVSRLRGTHVERVTAHPKRHRRPMGILFELVPALLQLPGALGVSPASMQALRRLTTGCSPDRGSGADDQSEAISQAITAALHDLVAAVNIETHLTIVVDDGHWVDAVSLELLFELVEAQRHRILLLVTTRDRQIANGALWGDETSVINLHGLTHDCVARLSRHGLQGTSAESDQELQLWMAKVAQGNPLFLESLVAHFRATGEQFKVPSSLHELLARRLAALQPNGMAVLQACVVLGALSTEKRLLACLEMPLVDLLSGLNELGRLRFIDTDGHSVLPAHPLMAEVLQASSPEAVLRLLHRKAATVLEQERDANDSPALLWDSADHWAAAGEPQCALETLRKCADHAHRIGRPADAADVLLKAATFDLADSARAELLSGAVLAAQRAGEHDRVLEGVAAMRRLNLPTAHDEIELAELSALSIVFVDSADFAGRVLACLESPLADSNHKVRVGLAALKYADTYSRPNLAASVAEAVSESDLAAVDELIRLEFRMVCKAAMGTPELVVPYARQIQSLTEQAPAATVVGAALNVGHAYWRAGLVKDSIMMLERVYELAEACGSVRRQLTAAMQIAVILCDQGDLGGVQLWRARAHALHESRARQRVEFEFFAFQMEFALTDRDRVRANNVLARADRNKIFSSPIRARWRRYFEARIRQLWGGPRLSPEELTILLSNADDLTSTSGIRDAETVVLCAELVAQGRRDQAQDRLRNFMSWRRRYSRAPLPAQLQDIVAECGLADATLESLAPRIRLNSTPHTAYGRSHWG